MVWPARAYRQPGDPSLRPLRSASLPRRIGAETGLGELVGRDLSPEWCRDILRRAAAYDDPRDAERKRRFERELSRIVRVKEPSSPATCRHGR